MDLLARHADTIAIVLALAGVVWRGAGIASDVRALKADVDELKASGQRHYERIYKRLEELGDRLARLEGSKQ